MFFADPWQLAVCNIFFKKSHLPLGQVADHDISEGDAAIGVRVNAAVDVLDEIVASPRQLGSDDVEQVSDDDLSVAAAVEEGTQVFEVLVAQLHAEVQQSPLQRSTRDLSR